MAAKLKHTYQAQQYARPSSLAGLKINIQLLQYVLIKSYFQNFLPNEKLNNLDALLNNKNSKKENLKAA